MRRIVEGFHVNDENVQKSFQDALLHVSYHETPRKTSLHIVLLAPKHPHFGQKAWGYKSIPPPPLQIIDKIYRVIFDV